MYSIWNQMKKPACVPKDGSSRQDTPGLAHLIRSTLLPRSNASLSVPLPVLCDSWLPVTLMESWRCGWSSFWRACRVSNGTFSRLPTLVRDVEKLDKPVFSVRAHESLINCIDGAGGPGSELGPPEIVTGGRDGGRNEPRLRLLCGLSLLLSTLFSCALQVR